MEAPSQDHAAPLGRRWRLLVGSRDTGITVEPDAQWANMWRIHKRGFVSDMVNLSRAKDAAAVMAGCDRSHPANWMRETAPGTAACARKTAPRARAHDSLAERMGDSA